MSAGVGIVLVSHSRPLALAVKTLVEAMTGPDLALTIAAGTGPGRSGLGTDAMEIVEAIQSVAGPAGVLVLMDMGSALLSAETALGFLEDDLKARVRLCSAPFVEGAVSAGVIAHAGGDLDAVEREARDALAHKTGHLDAPAPAAPPSTQPEAERVFPVRNRHGLHARPAAKLVQTAARFRAEVLVSNATTGKGPVSAKSLSGIGALEILQGHDLGLAASGPEAQAALQAIGELVASNFGEADEPDPSAPAGKGVLPVSDGIALGPAFLLATDEPSLPAAEAGDPQAELAKLGQAVRAAQAALGAETSAIFEAQQVLLDDPALREEAERLITTRRANAPSAWWQSVRQLRAQYEGLGDEYLRQRAADVSDAGRRVLEQLGVPMAASAFPREPFILVCDDVTPGEAARLRGTAVLGVVCRDGGRTSHGAILLRNLGIPAVAQARSRAAGVKAGVAVALDGAEGALWIDPAPGLRNELATRRDAARAVRDREAAEAALPAVTLDGRRIAVLANVGGVDDARAARRAGAEGIGLLRTEFLFLDRAAAPGEEEQYQALRAVADAFGPAPIVVRTLDAGGDKDLPYLRLPKEANPFLGVRALRISLRRPELFRAQLRAILRAGEGRDLRVMFPMVADIGELEQALQAVKEAHLALAAEKIAHLWPISAGIMIEIPSAALLADALAQRADFFSIGTNDLTQYTLAADRGNPELGAFQDALHPAVLALVSRIVEAGRRHRKPVAVCGEAAGDPLAARTLVGLGVGELSVTPAGIPRIKSAIRAMGALRLPA